MILGATSVLVPRFTIVSDPSTYLVVGVVLAIVGTAFVIKGSIKMAKTAAEIARDSESAVLADDSEE